MIKNLTDFRKTVEARVDPRLGNHLEMSPPVITFLFISINLCDLKKRRLTSFELVYVHYFFIFFSL